MTSGPSDADPERAPSKEPTPSRHLQSCLQHLRYPSRREMLLVIPAVFFLFFSLWWAGNSEHRQDRTKREAYRWSQIFVKKRLFNPESAEFPAYPDDSIEITISDDGTRFTVQGRVDTESPSGLRIYRTYRVELGYWRLRNQWDLLSLELR